MVADGVEQVCLAQAGGPVDEQGVVVRARLLGDRHGGGGGEAVGGSHHERVEAVAADQGAGHRGLVRLPGSLGRRLGSDESVRRRRGGLVDPVGDVDLRSVGGDGRRHQGVLVLVDYPLEVEIGGSDQDQVVVLIVVLQTAEPGLPVALGDGTTQEVGEHLPTVGRMSYLDQGTSFRPGRRGTGVVHSCIHTCGKDRAPPGASLHMSGAHDRQPGFAGK